MSSKTVICGATGMVGTKLAQQLHNKGHSLILVGRDSKKIRDVFAFETESLTWDELMKTDPQEIDVVINLAGAGVSDQKWTETYKQTMRDSRLKTTQKCVALCAKNPKIRLINASAVSAYGFYEQNHQPFTEEDKDKRSGTNFLQKLIDDWEDEAMKAQAMGNPVVLLRTGVVLDKSGGGLPSMAAPFNIFMGGPVGTGEQIMSWISLRDLVNGIVFIVENPQLSGPVNMVSTGACRQTEFAKALGKAMGKPSFMHTPSFMIKMMMGQLGQELVLTGQRVVPAKLLKAGFEFKDTDIDLFLTDLYQN